MTTTYSAIKYPSRVAWEAQQAEKRTSGQNGSAEELPRAAGGAIKGDEKFFGGDDGFDFFDFLDVINPLQHIPVVSNVYRAITGDEISHGARMAGGAVFGGPLGFASSVFASLVEDATTSSPAGATHLAETPAEKPAKQAVENFSQARETFKAADYQHMAKDDYATQILAALERANPTKIA